MNTPTAPSDTTPDAPPAGMGHNRPPAFDPDVLAQHVSTVDEFMAVTQTWLKMESIANERQAEQLSDQITGLRGLWKKVDEARSTAKKPHDEAGAEVQAAFVPILAKLKKAADALKPKLAAYVTAKAEAERAEKARQEAVARQAQRDAEERARLAAMDDDVSAQVEAEEALKAADKQIQQTTRKVSTSVKSATGAGRTMAAREIKEAQIDNINVLFMHFRDHPDVADTLRRLATAAIRAKGYDHEKAPVPGISVTNRTVIA